MSVATCTRLHAFKPLLILVAVCATVMISIANESICMQFPPLVTSMLLMVQYTTT